jgi:2'-5' RNA ligase
VIRLFVALEIPDRVKEGLGLLGGGVPGARWMSDDRLHLTLRFIGEVGENVANDIDDTLVGLRAPGFDMELFGVGEFGGKTPRALWAGVRPNDALLHLQKKIETALQRIGLPPEARKFSPHVTLAHLKAAPQEKVVQFLTQHALYASGPFRVDHFLLFSSHLGAGGSVYHPERVYELTRY